MSKRVGYGRVSSKGQEKNGNSLEDQREKLVEAGCDEIVLETFTGTTTDRPKFNKVLDSLEPGDTLIVCKLDRFARTAKEGLEVVEDLMARGVNVHILNMGLIEDTPMGRVILTVMLAFAQFERDTILERTQAGKATKKANDPNYKEGRPALEVPSEYYGYRTDVQNGDLTVITACKLLGVSKATWYKWAKDVG